MNWLCTLFSHNFNHISSTIFKNSTKRHWKCKRCGELLDEDIWHDI